MTEITWDVWAVRAVDDKVIIVTSGGEKGSGTNIPATSYSSYFELSKEEARTLALLLLEEACETSELEVDDPPPLDACAHCLALDYCLRNGFSDDACRRYGLS